MTRQHGLSFKDVQFCSKGSKRRPYCDLDHDGLAVGLIKSPGTTVPFSSLVVAQVSGCATFECVSELRPPGKGLIQDPFNNGSVLTTSYRPLVKRKRTCINSLTLAHLMPMDAKGQNINSHKAKAAGTLSRVRTISLFSGCGGSDLALKRLGYDVVWANDISEIACKTYRDNVGPVIEPGNIEDFSKFPNAEFLVGCYPCQGFTQGGRRNAGDSINYLYQQFDRVLRIVGPKAFVVENVNGMAFGENRQLLNNQLCRYRMAGYRVKWQVLDAQHYGVAQMRRRVFIVGIRSDLDFEYVFPAPIYGVATQKSPVSQKAVLDGLPEWPEGEFNDEPFHWYYLSRRRRHDWNEPSPCIVGHWRHVPLHPMSPPLKRIHTDKWAFSHEGRARRLAYRECAAIQGFPLSFVWKRGSIRERFQMIGNAVPPPLFEAVVRKLEDLW